MRPALKKYLQAIGWLLASMLSSCLNDVATKYLATGLSFVQICFCRFALGSLVLLPLVGYAQGLATQRPALHFFRGLFLCLAMGSYAYGLSGLAMNTATVIGFANPIFVLLLAQAFLREKVAGSVWAATLLAFAGIAWVVSPTGLSWSKPALACLAATFVFAALDVVNKKYVARESLLAMLFFSNLFAGLCLLPFAWYQWHAPTVQQLAAVTLLGVGSNLILYFLLKAFRLADAALLAPFRYVEWLISLGCGYFFFQEWPSARAFLSAGVVVAATCFMAYFQNRRP